jgi:glycolate oxidase
MPLPENHLLALHKILPNNDILTDPQDLHTYGYDGTAALHCTPDAVVFPRSTEQVSAVLKWASQQRIPIVTRGSGTGLSGGSVPTPASVVLCTVHMDRILEVVPNNLLLRTQPGVITQKIDEEAARHGLFYPPDPGSLRISTIGGNVAENSGGLRGLKYGVTRDYVMALEVVLMDGTIARFGSGCVKDVAGFSMKDVFIGSEGLLGVVTEILLRLIPRPAARRTMLASFSRMEDAAETVSGIIASRIIPCTLEFLDRNTIRCVEDFAHIGLPLDCEAILLMETDGHPAAVADEAVAMEKIARAHNAVSFRIAQNESEAVALASARRNAFSALARIRPTTILEDITVPRTELAAMVAFIAKTAKRHDLLVGTFGHMGDGNLHPTFLTDEKDRHEMERVHLALDEIVHETLRRGGTITGEHGVGLAKKPWLKLQTGDHSLSLMRRLKDAFDPMNLLNLGKMLD